MPRRAPTLVALAALAAGVATAPPAAAAGPDPGKQPVAIGTGGAVATVDPDATRIGLEVLAAGGNAADAAVAAAAALGVSEPYSAGVGGGGFFVYHDAATGTVSSIDGRETAPQAMGPDAFLDEAGAPLPFQEAVQSGLSVGVPGTPLTWERALAEFGTRSLAEVLEGPTRLAEDGFVVDETFRQQTAENEEKFRRFDASAQLWLPGGALPEVGSVFRNPDLVRTYEVLAAEGAGAFATGQLADDVVRTAQDPPEAPGAAAVRGGLLAAADLAAYDAPLREPTRIDYRGLEVYGMAPPSSGGSTVGEALNVLERFPLGSLSDVDALHVYLEASAVAFADRNAYVGDPATTEVPLAELLSDGFAAERACAVDPARAAARPVPAGTPDGAYDPCPAPVGATVGGGSEGPSTTHLTVADAEGNIASYTLTIEQTGGSGITVPGRGFILNNELTDFTFAAADPAQPEPNLPGPGKRPRSSMAPTIVLDDGAPVLALGSPGGATIITTVLQTLVGRLDRNADLGEAIAAPRASSRNGATTDAEPAFLEAYGADLTARGHAFAEVAEIGAATGVEFLPGGLLLAAAEPQRRGGGSAGVVRDVLVEGGAG
ncbi:gamma-glutamyltransferase [Geodermatophilus sabuli]|uniref:Glutathione hydrolase proenzyme n=1 Tax=Geodermatophilus sabuli TaxID=1564158 RepID=A0A285EHE3_9ACTN|nr:gamma-glutamyltransferase [Geodermatophilus sabuli]MBB3083888.1 gamma-glutamyltranspeptidase/glutathione hydrolase [Geodermatophilus sabuli]SNX98539.1 gamma-glutamyltranspeptidase / glutathione hydrolase [Geodermatophilus sabuli]